MYTKEAEWHVKYISVTLFRSVHSVSQAVYVLLACCQMVKEAVLRRRTVPAHIMENTIILDRISLWTAIPGEPFNLFHTNAVLCQLTAVCFFNWILEIITWHYFICLNHSTCKSRKWNCTDHECAGTCTIYGEGHYITFDEKKFSFNGDCGYVFTQV